MKLNYIITLLPLLKQTITDYLPPSVSTENSPHRWKTDGKTPFSPASSKTLHLKKSQETPLNNLVPEDHVDFYTTEISQASLANAADRDQLNQLTKTETMGKTSNKTAKTEARKAAQAAKEAKGGKGTANGKGKGRKGRNGTLDDFDGFVGPTDADKAAKRKENKRTPGRSPVKKKGKHATQEEIEKHEAEEERKLNEWTEENKMDVDSEKNDDSDPDEDTDPDDDEVEVTGVKPPKPDEEYSSESSSSSGSSSSSSSSSDSSSGSSSDDSDDDLTSEEREAKAKATAAMAWEAVKKYKEAKARREAELAVAKANKTDEPNQPSETKNAEKKNDPNQPPVVASTHEQQPSIRRCIVDTLRRRDQSSKFADFADASVMEAATDQDAIGWIHFIEGRISRKWREAQQEHYLLSGSQRSTRKWAEDLAMNMFSFVHKQWMVRNSVVHARDEKGLKIKEGEVLRAAITEQFDLGIDGLRPADRHYIAKGRRAVEKMSGTEQKTWIHGIRIAREAYELEADSEITQLWDSMYGWLQQR